MIGGGHAGAEAAWACAKLLAGQAGCSGKTGSVGLVTLRADTIGTMSCNPAIGGLAKGQLVREIDALGGLMGLAADAAGINFKVLNTAKGSAAHGPRAQCDKHAYARAVRALVVSRDEIEVIEGAGVESVVESGVDGDHARGVVVSVGGEAVRLDAGAVVLTTGTFMRGLMHTGEQQTPGGRHGEAATSGISKWLADAGFELGRLKTGTPPRLTPSPSACQRSSPKRQSATLLTGTAVPSSCVTSVNRPATINATPPTTAKSGSAEARSACTMPPGAVMP